MKKGFTLLELIVVIIILGILATLGFSQYVKMVEKGRTAEAKTVLGQIRSAQAAYSQEHGSGVYANTLTDLSVDAPAACTTTHYFSYATTGVTSTATRCLAAGKSPNGTSAYTITIDATAGTWSGDNGYY